MLADICGTRLFFDIDGMQWVPDGARMKERPVLFLLHGGPGGDHVSFKTQLGSLRDVAQLVFIDHRGSGRSAPCEPGTCTLEHNVEDIEALRQYLGLERIAVLGSSYGGMVAQGYATRYPEQV
ncbi:MAG: alpha/beta fold hydrolase, partial [Planctomycetaceae bacterium]|nr:alpha/beta fold hydrolase [Planctomycetaceae bacterium]